MDIIERIKGAVIVSSQAQKNEPFYDETAMLAMMKSVVDGGAQGLRLAGGRDIRNARANWPDIPIIGITKPDIIPKNYKELVYITPTLEDVELVASAGADVIAFDATLRPREVSIEALISKIHEVGCLAMADISSFVEGASAVKLGADLVSTTLSGYTTNTHPRGSDGPDFELLKVLITLGCPVVLEGRIWEPYQIKRGFELGAHCVVIGSAITRPKEIVRHFMERK